MANNTFIEETPVQQINQVNEEQHIAHFTINPICFIKDELGYQYKAMIFATEKLSADSENLKDSCFIDLKGHRNWRIVRQFTLRELSDLSSEDMEKIHEDQNNNSGVSKEGSSLSLNSNCYIVDWGQDQLLPARIISLKKPTDAHEFCIVDSEGRHVWRITRCLRLKEVSINSTGKQTHMIFPLL